MKIDEFEEQLRSALRSRHQPVAGALMTYVYKVTERPEFLTLRCEFADEARLPREQQTYRTLVLGESWHDGTSALDDLLSTLSGKRELIPGFPVPEFASMSFEGRKFGSDTYTAWSEDRYSHLLTNGSTPWGPIVGVGRVPYRSADVAIDEWVWRRKGYRGWLAGLPYFIGCVVLLPDTRARIRHAEWTGDRLLVECDFSVSSGDIEVQVILDDADAVTNVSDSKPIEACVEWATSDTASSAEVFLVHKDGSILGNAKLSRGAHFSARAGEMSVQEQAQIDVRAGESEQIEYKPFVEIKDTKEWEIVNTIIAFANTSGGRLYIGVTNDGDPQEDSVLRKVGKADSSQSIDLLASRVRELARERIRPVPNILVTPIALFGFRVIVVSVPIADNPPLSNSMHDVYVRKGSSNFKPDPITELPALYSRAKAR